MIYGTFIVTTMVAERGIPEVTAGRFWAWVGFFSLFSGPLFGTLSDRIGRKGGFMTVFAVQAVAYALASVDIGMWALYLSIALYGIAAWSIPTIMTAAVGDYFGLARGRCGFFHHHLLLRRGADPRSGAGGNRGKAHRHLFLFLPAGRGGDRIRRFARLLSAKAAR